MNRPLQSWWRRKPCKIVGYSCVVVKDDGEKSQANDVIEE